VPTSGLPVRSRLDRDSFQKIWQQLYTDLSGSNSTHRLGVSRPSNTPVRTSVFPFFLPISSETAESRPASLEISSTPQKASFSNVAFSCRYSTPTRHFVYFANSRRQRYNLKLSLLWQDTRVALFSIRARNARSRKSAIEYQSHVLSRPTRTAPRFWNDPASKFPLLSVNPDLAPRENSSEQKSPPLSAIGSTARDLKVWLESRTRPSKRVRQIRLRKSAQHWFSCAHT